MTHISAMSILADTRQREMLAEAERHRRRRQARAGLARRRWWQGWLRARRRPGERPRQTSRAAVTPCP